MQKRRWANLEETIEPAWKAHFIGLVQSEIEGVLLLV